MRDLNSTVFVALPNLIHLNLSFNNFSILTVSVTVQLAKLRNVIDLQGNPWVCDCLMYNTMYSWCTNNSVDLSLVCSGPSRFEGKLWKIYEEEGCDDDDYGDDDNDDNDDDYYGDDDNDDDGDYTDVEYQVENFTIINDHLTSNGSHDNYNIPWPSGPLSTQIQEENMQNHSVYFYSSIGLLFLCPLTIAILSYRRRFTSRRLTRTGPEKLDVEQYPLSTVNR
jgi:hypothetical protein